jgi:hypothetical protein
MTDTEMALLELRLLKQGTPYHVHTGDVHFICTSPYCTNLFATQPAHGPQLSQAEADGEYNHGEIR